MDVPASEVGYTSATTGRGDHEVRKGHVVALAQKKIFSQTILANVWTEPYVRLPLFLSNTFHFTVHYSFRDEHKPEIRVYLKIRSYRAVRDFHRGY
jgi:hypothetical protein